MFERLVTRSVGAVLTMAVCGALPACSQQVSSEGTSEVGVESLPLGAVPLSRTPMEIQRRVQQHLSAVQSAGTDWQKATLAPYAVPLLRPDVEGIAYYDFPVIGADGSAQGYLIAATGEHDDPLPLVSQSGPSPTTRLRALSTSAPVRFYLLDVLSFAAEGADGALVAKLGELPRKLEWRGDLGGIEDSAFDGFSDREPTASSDSDAAQARLDSVVRREFQPTPPFAVKSWANWAELKRGFKASYGPVAQRQAAFSARAWSREAALSQQGEALAVGESRRIELLEPGLESAAVYGSGAPAVELTREANASGGESLVLRVASTPAKAADAVELRVQYASGRQETLRYGLYETLPRQAQSVASRSAALPGALGGGLHVLTNPNPHNPNDNTVRITTTWSGDYPEVGHTSGSGDDPSGNSKLKIARTEQAWYNQLDKGAKYNSYDCLSGCGGTAWAMLLAWADNRAEDDNSPWASRWGIYRRGGAIAPGGANAKLSLSWKADDAHWFVGALSYELDGTLAGCTSDGERYVAPNLMDEISDFVHARSAVGIHTTYNLLGKTSAGREDLVKDEIMKNDRPAIAGVGADFAHYTLVYGIEIVDQIWVGPTDSGQTEAVRWRINNGWGSEDASDATMTPRAWFVGRIDPNPGASGDVFSSSVSNACSPNGRVEHQACPSGYIGSGVIRECRNLQWFDTDTDCSKQTSPSNPKNPQNPK